MSHQYTSLLTQADLRRWERYLVRVAVKKNFIVLPIFQLKCHWLLNNFKSPHTAKINKPSRKIYTGRWPRLIGTYVRSQMGLEYTDHARQSQYQKENKEKGLYSSSPSKHCFPFIFLLCSSLRHKGMLDLIWCRGTRESRNGEKSRERKGMGKKAEKGKGLGKRVGVRKICPMGF